MYGYIYKITDLTNGKCYIGQHKYDKPELDPKYHGSGYLIKKIYNARPDTLLEEILMICETLEEANYFEEYFIEHLNTMHPYGYNLNTGGDQYRPSRYTRIKMARSAKKRVKKYGLPSGTWSKENCPKPNPKGSHLPQETKDKISKTLKGHPSPNPKGQKRPEVTGNKNGRYIKVCPLMLYKYLLIDKLSCNKTAQMLNIGKDCLRNKRKEFQSILNEWKDL